MVGDDSPISGDGCPRPDFRRQFDGPRDGGARVLLGRKGKGSLRGKPISVTHVRDTSAWERSSWEASAEAIAFASIVRSSADAVIAKAIDGTITAWNAGAESIYGYTAQQIVGQNIGITIPEEARDAEDARHRRVAEGAAESGYRCVRVMADGTPVEVVMSMSPVRDVSGQVVGMASISRPVSVAEHAETRFASLLEAAPDAILCVDVSQRITSVNARACALFGYAREDLIGAEMEALLPAGVYDGRPPSKTVYFDERAPHRMGNALSLVGCRRDGSTFPAEVSFASDGTQDQRVIASIRDVSERRALESALRTSETRFRQLAESVDVVFLLRQMHPPQYLYVSPAYHTLLGRDPDELLGRPEVEIEVVHPDDRDLYSIFRQRIQAGEAATSEHRLLTESGGVRWIRSVATPVPNPDGATERSVLTMEDITDRIDAAEVLREAEAAARAANEAKNLFLSRMSHELRTPLNAVLGFGQLLSLQLAGTEHADAIGYIVKGGRHLLDLINDVLDIARIESGAMSISLEPVDVSDLVDETIQLMQPLALAAGVKVVSNASPVDSDTTALCVLGDRQRLRQILLNLLSNGIKYNRVGGTVWVGWRASGGAVLLTVSDNGPGIASELQSRLFTPFDRLGADNSGIDGTGIGLALTRALAELMGGSISVTSVPGEGSTFAVSLSSVEPPSLVPDPPIAGATGAASPGPVSATMLYVEDNEPNVRVVEHLVRLRPEWRMIHAATGRLGLELARAHTPNLILLDLHLPDMGGREVLEALKHQPETADAPVVILTADASPGKSRDLVLAGAERVLTKPLEVEVMLTLLDRIATPQGPRA